MSDGNFSCEGPDFRDRECEKGCRSQSSTHTLLAPLIFLWALLPLPPCGGGDGGAPRSLEDIAVG